MLKPDAALWVFPHHLEEIKIKITNNQKKKHTEHEPNYLKVVLFFTFVWNADVPWRMCILAFLVFCSIFCNSVNPRSRVNDPIFRPSVSHTWPLAFQVMRESPRKRETRAEGRSPGSRSCFPMQLVWLANVYANLPSRGKVGDWVHRWGGEGGGLKTNKKKDSSFRKRHLALLNPPSRNQRVFFVVFFLNYSVA